MELEYSIQELENELKGFSSKHVLKELVAALSQLLTCKTEASILFTRRSFMNIAMSRVAILPVWQKADWMSSYYSKLSKYLLDLEKT